MPILMKHNFAINEFIPLHHINILVKQVYLGWQVFWFCTSMLEDEFHSFLVCAGCVLNIQWKV